MQHTPDEFLSAIEATPADRVRRLVFADWLDEHDDPRGELIRVEEEMRGLPVFSDRFWELKPRRNALRAQAGSEWCGRMRYGTECEPVFRHGIPEGWRERWRLIREFTERWHRVPMPDVGGRQAEIAEAETRLGRKLPPSVREWIALVHDWRHVTQNPYFFGNEEIREVPNQPAISLGHLVPSSIALGVRFEDLRVPDPPVYRFTQPHSRESDTPNWALDRRLYSAVTIFTLMAAVTKVRGTGGSFMAEAEPEHLDALRDSFSVGPLDGDETLYECDNILVKEFRSPWKQGQRAVSVTFFKTLSRDQIPPVIWDCAVNRRPGYGEGFWLPTGCTTIRAES